MSAVLNIEAVAAAPLPAPGRLPANDTETAADLLALEVFDRLDNLPHRYFVHLEHNHRNAPLIRAGEIVVVDQGGATQGGWCPTEGGLFVIEHRSRVQEGSCERYPRVSREVVQTHEGKHGWYASPLTARTGSRFVCSDGPYNDEMALADKLIGKVVGIYVPGGEVRQ